MCHRPAVFFCHRHLIALSFSQGKVRRAFQNNVILLFYFSLNRVAVSLPNLTLPKSGSACVKRSTVSVMLSYCEAASLSKQYLYQI
jgi:hypothetical protein